MNLFVQFAFSRTDLVVAHAHAEVQSETCVVVSTREDFPSDCHRARHGISASPSSCSSQAEVSTRHERMVAFRRSSPFNHRHFSLRPRIDSSSSSGVAPRESGASSQGAQADSQDSKLSKERNSTYPIYLVIAFLAVLLAISLLNAVHRLNLFAAKVRKRRPSRKAIGPSDSSIPHDKPYQDYSRGYSITESHSRPPNSKQSVFRRCSVAVINALRVVSFRKTRIPLFKVFIGALYLFLPLTFFLINSECGIEHTRL